MFIIMKHMDYLKESASRPHLSPPLSFYMSGAFLEVKLGGVPSVEVEETRSSEKELRLARPSVSHFIHSVESLCVS